MTERIKRSVAGAMCRVLASLAMPALKLARWTGDTHLSGHMDEVFGALYCGPPGENCRHKNWCREEDCENCDGRGRYEGWPHTTCPTCGGSGVTPDSGEGV
jgi:hypothetical protein